MVMPRTGSAPAPNWRIGDGHGFATIEGCEQPEGKRTAGRYRPKWFADDQMPVLSAPLMNAGAEWFIFRPARRLSPYVARRSGGCRRNAEYSY